MVLDQGGNKSADIVSITKAAKKSAKNNYLLGLDESQIIENRERKLLYISNFSADCLRLISTIESYGWQTFTAEEISHAEAITIKHDIPVGLIDIKLLENSENLQHWEKMFLSNPDNKWLALLTKESTSNPKLIELVKHRFYDYHTLPVDSGRLLMALGHAYGMANLKIKSQLNSDILSSKFGILGSSPVMIDFYKDLYKISGVDATVLVGGESGTGKESAAYAIHKLSRRGDGPFVAVNCGSIPSNLIQSELFGHEKGAFTGAHRSKTGRIEAAQGGTIFLDEIGDLPFELQINLLRFLQEQTIERVGGNKSVKVDVRVIAATHVDLEGAVKEGRLREDLYYRLNVLRLIVPRLADRGSDIELLAYHFFEKLASEKNPKLKGFSQSAIESMRRYSWPGNIRELINRVRHAMVMSDNKLITSADLGIDPQEAKPILKTLANARASAEEEVVIAAIKHAGKNISHAASSLNVSRATLYRLMEKYNLIIDEESD